MKTLSLLLPGDAHPPKRPSCSLIGLLSRSAWVPTKAGLPCLRLSLSERSSPPRGVEQETCQASMSTAKSCNRYVRAFDSEYFGLQARGNNLRGSDSYLSSAVKCTVTFDSTERRSSRLARGFRCIGRPHAACLLVRVEF